MTRFLFHNPDSQFRVNDLCLSKINVQIFLRDLRVHFKRDSEFTIYDIKSNYSSKTERAIIFIALQFKIIIEVENKKKIPKLYRFTQESDELIERLMDFKMSCDQK